MSDTDFTTQQTILTSELLIKVSTLESILIKKGIILKEDVEEETKLVVEKLRKIVQETVKQQQEETK